MEKIRWKTVKDWEYGKKALLTHLNGENVPKEMYEGVTNNKF